MLIFKPIEKTMQQFINRIDDLYRLHRTLFLIYNFRLDFCYAVPDRFGQITREILYRVFQERITVDNIAMKGVMSVVCMMAVALAMWSVMITGMRM